MAMCLKCLAITRCGNDCCRHKSSGPYWSRVERDGDWFMRCEPCGFEIQADADEDLYYRRYMACGTWPTLRDDPPEIRAQRIEQAQIDYAALCQRFLTHDVRSVNLPN